MRRIFLKKVFLGPQHTDRKIGHPSCEIPKDAHDFYHVTQPYFLVIISAVRISVLNSLISCTACKTFPILPEVEKSSKLLRYAEGSNLSIFTILKIQFCDAFKETLAYQICKFSTFLAMPNSQAASRSFESDKVG